MALYLLLVEKLAATAFPSRILRFYPGFQEVTQSLRWIGCCEQIHGISTRSLLFYQADESLSVRTSSSRQMYTVSYCSKIAYFNEALILDEVTFDTIATLPNIPGAVDTDRGGRTYPLEGAFTREASFSSAQCIG